MDLRSKLPYTEAVLLEIQRRGNVVPTALLHTVNATTHLENYVLPKGTHIIPNLTVVLMDPAVFPNPDKFIPERFLNENGSFVPHPNVVPFGVGKRRCLGETLAKAELFVFFVSLLHKFDIKLVNDNEKPSTMYRVGVTLSPQPFRARFIARI
jgi:cytochrome P450